jgi:flagellar biosynthesis GTPase FlhF
MPVLQYRVRTMGEAIALVRRKHGSEAVILDARRVYDRTGQSLLEVDVAVRNDDPVAVELIRSTRSETHRSAVPAIPLPRGGAERETGALPRVSTAESPRLGADRGAAPHGGVARQPGRRPTLSGSMQALRFAINADGNQGMRALTSLYDLLSNHGVLPAHAESIVAEQLHRGPKEVGEDLRNRVQGYLASQFATVPPAWKPRGQRVLLTMVGPAGVGKTTTVAKIAAHASVVEGRSVGLIAADTHRIGGVYQIERYASLLGIPFEVCATPVEMDVALERMADVELLLMDTTGRNPFREMEALRRTGAMIEMCTDRERQVHLCAPATTRARELIELTHGYAIIQPTALSVTRMDEATSWGALLSMAMECSLPFAQLSHGPTVPSDILPADAQELAWAVLEGEPPHLVRESSA